MKKIKKIFSVLLTLAMVLGMSMTSFAAPKTEATITVKNADKATLTYAQVIVPDQTTKTGWAFVNDKVADAYKGAFNVNDAQSAIEKLIAADGLSEEVAKALSNVVGIEGMTWNAMSNPQKVTSAGVYVIRATEAGFTYNNMAAYVGFGALENNEYPSLVDAELNAKKSDIKVTKDNNDDDDVVAIGDTITYTIKTNVPYMNPNDENKTFYIYDNIEGATYFELDKATVTMAGNPVAASLVENKDGKGFSVDLSSLIKNDNSNAGKEIVVTYKAKVTAVTVNNEASSGHDSGDRFDSDHATTYTGQIELTKYNDYKTDAEKELLKGAGFEVTKEGSNEALKFVQDVNAEGQTIEGSYTYDPNGTITEVFTGEDGKVTVKGLNVGKYHFTEKTAPTGYHINEAGADATIKVEGEKATAIVEAKTELKDSTLSALPGTGGIGTTIFTIGGCLIMIIAAALFFASRKKQQH